jgi:hypothetical protein
VIICEHPSCKQEFADVKSEVAHRNRDYRKGNGTQSQRGEEIQWQQSTTQPLQPANLSHHTCNREQPKASHERLKLYDTYLVEQYPVRGLSPYKNDEVEGAPLIVPVPNTAPWAHFAQTGYPNLDIIDPHWVPVAGDQCQSVLMDQADFVQAEESTDA